MTNEAWFPPAVSRRTWLSILPWLPALERLLARIGDTPPISAASASAIATFVRPCTSPPPTIEFLQIKTFWPPLQGFCSFGSVGREHVRGDFGNGRAAGEAHRQVEGLVAGRNEDRVHADPQRQRAGVRHERRRQRPAPADA